MSNRLKRKLGDLGIDPSSAKANESFCLIGTPLPPLEKSKDTGEFVPLWKQDVRDEQGRRRLHGAFTGGFSAGYFNTVGSKEGWTPSTFVSSRSDRAKHKGKRPEDFMDEEDLAELREGQKMVDESDEMDLLGGTQAELSKKGAADEPEKDAITSALEASMLPPPKDSVGARILKKMGWRLGQGIGPRLTWRQRKIQDLQASTGPEIDVDTITEDDEEARKHTYAPRDTPILQVERKDNFHGLGYKPGMGLNDSLGAKNEGPKGPNLSSGFGLGALNDADDDDIDVYDGSLNSARRHMAYDISEHDDGDRIVIGSNKHHEQNKPEQRSASSVQTFQDGRPVLSGFILSDKPVAEDRWFPLPEVPKGWKPDPKRVWAKNKENAENFETIRTTASQQPISHGKWKTGISADNRGTLLGETPLPSTPRSVFEYISQKDRERIQNIASNTPAAESGSEPSQRPALPSSIIVPRTESHIAQAALRGFQPFPTDPIKQARYTAYLQSQATPDPDRPIGFVPIGIIPGQSIDEFNKELSDYAKAATIFKPISGAMAGRFTSAAVVDNAPKVVEGLHTPSVESENARVIAQSQATEVEAKEEESPKAHAARMGLYGRMTREVQSWQPARLLCKRFGVKDPNPEPVVDTQAAASPGATAGPVDTAMPEVPAFTGTESFRAPSGAGLSGRIGGSDSQPGKKDPSNIGLGEDDSQGRDTLTYEKPAMDIFKAIFASDEEDSDGEDESKVDETDNKTSGPSAGPGTIPLVNNAPGLPAPPHLGVGSSESPSYEPASNGAAPQSVDIASFKPTFIPRDGKKLKEKDKSKKDKKKKSEKTIVSFELDEDGGESLALSIPKEKSGNRPKKKKRKEKDRKEGGEDGDDESIWVEKPLPEAVKNVVLGGEPRMTSVADSMDVDAEETLGDKGRKKAIDFW